MLNELGYLLGMGIAGTLIVIVVIPMVLFFWTRSISAGWHSGRGFLLKGVDSHVETKTRKGTAGSN